MHWTEPATADDYLLNGNLSVHRQRRRPEPALEWVMERQSVTTDKDSGITNDANLWATETMGFVRMVDQNKSGNPNYAITRAGTAFAASLPAVQL